MTTPINSDVQRVNHDVAGNQLSVLEAGDSSNPVALFLHGIPANVQLWTDTLAKVAAAGYYALALELPGFGETTVVDDRYYGIKGSAELAMQWLKQQDLNDIWLVSHDIGGGVAQVMLTMDEARFTKATLSNSIAADSWPIPAMTKLIEAAKAGEYVSAAEAGEIESELGPFVTSTFTNKELVDDALLARVFLDGKVNTDAGREKFSKLLSSLDNRETIEIMDDVAKLSLPVHMIWAMSDPHQPWDGPGQILENTLQNVRVDRIEQSGHFLQLDFADEYYRLLMS